MAFWNRTTLPGNNLMEGETLTAKMLTSCMLSLASKDTAFPKLGVTHDAISKLSHSRSHSSGNNISLYSSSFSSSSSSSGSSVCSINGVPPSSPTKEGATGETIERAIDQGQLLPSFRTRLCKYYSSRSPCAHGERCQFAHGVGELRVEAAIQQGCLPPGFKTRICNNYLVRGVCPHTDCCHFAHGVEELRIEAAIQQGYLPPSFKTKLCHFFTVEGHCSHCDRCHFAHGLGELRVEAAITQGVLPPTFKTRLCSFFAARGQCPRGDFCHFAHGDTELRHETSLSATDVAPDTPALPVQTNGVLLPGELVGGPLLPEDIAGLGFTTGIDIDLSSQPCPYIKPPVCHPESHLPSPSHSICSEQQRPHASHMLPQHLLQLQTAAYASFLGTANASPWYGVGGSGTTVSLNGMGLGNGSGMQMGWLSATSGAEIWRELQQAQVGIPAVEMASCACNDTGVFTSKRVTPSTGLPFTAPGAFVSTAAAHHLPLDKHEEISTRLQGLQLQREAVAQL